MKFRILLIEDDESLGHTLRENLTLEGYIVELSRDGFSGLELARSEVWNLVVLDVSLPHLSGFEVLKKIRTFSEVPVMFISARGAAKDRIEGLQLTADDYLPKPFHLKEFLLRVQSLLRRKMPTVTPITESRVRIGNARFDLVARSVELDDGTREVLGDKETGLLKLFLSRPNKVVSRQEILDSVWGLEQNPTARTVDNFVVKLRRWIEPQVSDPQWILSHRGIGYCLRWNFESKTSNQESGDSMFDTSSSKGRQ